MAYKNPYIQQAYATKQSTYNNVNDVKNNALTALDAYSTQAQSSYDSAYKAYDAALAQQLQNQKDVNAYGVEVAQREFNDQQKTFNNEYMQGLNRSGTTNETMTRSGLKGSGYEETIRGQSFGQYQAKVSAAETALSDKLAKLSQELNAAIYQNDVEKASQLQARIAEGNSLLQYIQGQISSIMQSAYSNDYSERQFAEQTNQNRISNSQTERSLKLQEDSINTEGDF